MTFPKDACYPRTRVAILADQAGHELSQYSLPISYAPRHSCGRGSLLDCPVRLGPRAERIRNQAHDANRPRLSHLLARPPIADGDANSKRNAHRDVDTDGH